MVFFMHFDQKLGKAQCDQVDEIKGVLAFFLKPKEVPGLLMFFPFGFPIPVCKVTSRMEAKIMKHQVSNPTPE